MKLIEISHCLAIDLSQALCIWADSVPGLSLPDKSNGRTKRPPLLVWTGHPTLSPVLAGWTAGGRAWMQRDAKKAKGASIRALLMPSPPCRTGSVAYSHCDSLRSTFRIEESPCFSVLSNVVRSGLSEQSDYCLLLLLLLLYTVFNAPYAPCVGWLNDEIACRRKVLDGLSPQCLQFVR